MWSPVLCWVSRTTCSSPCRTAAGTPFGRPTTRKRVLRAMRSGSSDRIARSSSFMSVETSCAGRLQFSVEKAYSVRYRSPSASAARTIARAVFTPSRWPATRGKPRRVAQRPLPSMMTAMCSGIGCDRTTSRSSVLPSVVRSVCRYALAGLSAIGRSSHIRLLDRLELRRLPGLDHQRPCVRHRHGGHLVHWRGRPVVVHADAVEEPGRGAARTHGRELAPERVERDGHPGLDILQYRLHSGQPPPEDTIEPTGSPRTMRRMFPGRVRSKTTIGSAFSMQSEMAVVSITCNR